VATSTFRGGRGVVAAVLALVLVGCTTAPAAAPRTTASSATTGSSAAPANAQQAAPAKVRIPKIDATSSLVEVGLNPDQTLEVPSIDQPMQAAWYRLGPVPGQPGPAVLLGHVDGKSKPGIFFRLREVAENDEILVDDNAGATRKFVVYRTKQVPKDVFPTEEVYGDTAGPELRVITCGGSFDTAANSYRDNTIVFAKLAA